MCSRIHTNTPLEEECGLYVALCYDLTAASDIINNTIQNPNVHVADGSKLELQAQSMF